MSGIIVDSETGIVSREVRLLPAQVLDWALVVAELEGVTWTVDFRPRLDERNVAVDKGGAINVLEGSGRHIGGGARVTGTEESGCGVTGRWKAWGEGAFVEWGRRSDGSYGGGAHGQRLRTYCEFNKGDRYQVNNEACWIDAEAGEDSRLSIYMVDH